MSKLNAARERTDAKLRYADVHLVELEKGRLLDSEQGTDWEQAHQESFLFHLFGVKDALLQEINLFHVCDLPMRRVSIGSISQKLVKSGSESRALRTLMKLEGMKSTWISAARRFRNVLMHQKNIPTTYHWGGENHRKVFLEDLLTRKLIETDYRDLFKQWHGKATKLVKNLRDKMPGAENG